ncbi:hypothetical protein ACYJ1Y_04690 [Natrialbaceae archaeon A-gly3]
MTTGRRAFLERATTTVTAATIAVAGWPTVAAQEDDETDLPDYSRWLTLEADTLEFTYVDWATLEEYVEEELEQASPAEDVPEEYRTDPMVAPASDGLIMAYFFVGLTLGQFGLGRLLDEGEFESVTEELLRVDGTFVVTGDMVTAEIDERLTREPIADFIVQMERTDEISGYDVYTPTEDDADVVIALDDDALLVVDGDETDEEPSTALETAIDAAAGNVPRATEDSETLAWLLETAGFGDVAVGQYGGPFDADELRHQAFEGLEDAEGIVSSFTVEDEETLVGDLAAVLAEPDEDALEAFVGVSADERSIDVEEDRVTVTGTWREKIQYE